jgi:hypothetical protein
VRKYDENMALVASPARAAQVRELVLAIGRDVAAADLQAGLAARG